MSRYKKILVAFLAIVLLYCAVNISIYIFDSYNTENEVEGLERKMDISASETSAIPAPMPEIQAESVILPEFKDLVQQNDELIGWLKIEGTPISYPVMHTPEDGEFYLDHGFDRQESKSGLPFMDYRSSITKPTANWIIYGHNMKNGSMFHALMNYKSEEYYKEHSVIRFDTLYEQGQYEIIAVILSKVYQKNEDVFKYYQFVNAETQTEFDIFIENIKQLALYDTGLSAQYGDQIITLSTCEYSTANGRLALIARKL